MSLSSQGQLADSQDQKVPSGLPERKHCCILGDVERGLQQFSIACITNYHQLLGLKQYTRIISQFLGVRNLGWLSSGLIRLRSTCSPWLGLTGFSGSLSRAMEVVARIQYVEAVEFIMAFHLLQGQQEKCLLDLCPHLIRPGSAGCCPQNTLISPQD